MVTFNIINGTIPTNIWRPLIASNVNVSTKGGNILITVRDKDKEETSEIDSMFTIPPIIIEPPKHK